jgi:hypothetical protein
MNSSSCDPLCDVAQGYTHGLEAPGDRADSCDAPHGMITGPIIIRPRAHTTLPPISELTRIEPVHLARLERQGVFTTGMLLEVSETPTRRQTLADQVDASTNDVLTWRDEALMLNLAGFGPNEHLMLSQAGFEGLREILAVDLDTFRARVARGAQELNMEPPSDLTLESWWEQARTLEDE